MDLTLVSKTFDSFLAEEVEDFLRKQGRMSVPVEEGNSMTTSTAEMITVTDKKDVRKDARTVVEKSAKQIQRHMRQLPKTGAEVAGYFKAMAVTGDHSKDKNPIANFARQNSGVYASLLSGYVQPQVTADRDNLYIEHDGMEACVPLDAGARMFMEGFSRDAMYHHLYEGNDTACKKLRDDQS